VKDEEYAITEHAMMLKVVIEPDAKPPRKDKPWRWKLRDRDDGDRIVAAGVRRHATADAAAAELRAFADCILQCTSDGRI
jgi:hypothetical protein